MNITEEQREYIKKSNQELIEKLEDFKLHPEKYREPKYMTPDGSRIAVIQEDDNVVSGVVVQSKWKSQIGFCNTFLKTELKPFLRLKCNHPSHKK